MKSFITLVTTLVMVSQMSAQVQKPKLVVGIVIDQMRTDFLYRYWDKFGNDGFKKLVNEGFFFRNAHFNYIPTYTAPGHASIYSGTTPMVHGIVGNDWFDERLSDHVYCVEDPNVSAVGATGKARGMSPHRLLTPTLGDALRIASNFRGKSIGISLKDRGAILPAGHSANAAYWMDYRSGAMITSTYYMDRLPKWVAEFNHKKHADELIAEGWSPLLALQHYTESTADDTPYEGTLSGEGKPVFPYDVKSAVANHGYYPFASTPMANTLLRMFAESVLINEDLGADEHTDLLAISFSSTDILGHTYGPQSIEVEDMYLRLDLEIARLIRELDQRVGQGNYLLFLTADHAAAHVPQYLMDHKIPVKLFDEDQFQTALGSHLENVFGRSDLIRSYSNQQVYLNDSVIRSGKWEYKHIYDEIRSFTLAYDGVCNTLDVKQLQHPLPPDRFAELAALGWNPQRSGDVVIQYLPGWMAHSPRGTTHGSSYNYDTHVPVIFYGTGVPQGESISEVNITRIAPTVSLLARIAFPDASEREPVVFEGN